MHDQKPIKIALSIGEPAGIGVDQIIMLCNDLTIHKNQKNTILFAFTDSSLIKDRAQLLNLDIDINEITEKEIEQIKQPIYNKNNKMVLNVVSDINSNNAQLYNTTPGIPDVNNANYVIKQLKAATISCLNKQCDALVTCPINKSIINQAGISFTGHTEYIASLSNDYYKPTNNYQPIMMLSGKDFSNLELRVALITTHLPLKNILANISTKDIINKILIINHELINKLKIINPKILITGLNPHAGENGALGNEEIEIIIPAIDQLRAKYKINIDGPHSADSCFQEKIIKNYDIIIAMYHDQGLTGFKARTFGNATNVTLGLPIIRTSVDHGTALNLAGTGNISISSLKFAINTAINIVEIT